MPASQESGAKSNDEVISRNVGFLFTFLNYGFPKYIGAPRILEASTPSFFWLIGGSP